MTTLPTFEELLSRADEEALQRFLGRPTVRLMQATLGRNLTIARMRSALQEIRPAHQLLEDASIAELLFEMFRPAEVALLSETVLGTPCTAKHLLSQIRPRTRAFDRVLEALHVSRPLPPLEAESRPTSLTCRPIYSLFTHQRNAMRKVLAALESRPYRVMLHMPTGSGKTRTAMQVAAHYLRRRDDTTVVWLATTEELCEQAAEEFATTWQYCGDRDVQLVRAWGSHTLKSEELTDRQPKLVIAGLAKLHAARFSNQTMLPRLGDLVSLVIFDEAHQSIAATYRAVVDVLVSKSIDTRLLGLSATPGRSWNDVTADAKLSSYFGKEKVTLEIQGYSSPVDYLIEQGYLARPVFRRIEHHSRESLSASEIRTLAEALDVPEELRSRLAADDIRNLSIVRECQQLLRSHKRLLVFAATVAHAELIAVVLRGLGIAAYPVTGKSGTAERARHISWYRSHDAEPRVLVNYGILATGFDAPNTSAALIARPTRSLVLYSQMVGRAMRGPRAGGNNHAEIVTVVDTSLPGFGDPAAAFSNWEDIW